MLSHKSRVANATQPMAVVAGLLAHDKHTSRATQPTPLSRALVHAHKQRTFLTETSLLKLPYTMIFTPFSVQLAFRIFSYRTFLTEPSLHHDLYTIFRTTCLSFPTEPSLQNLPYTMILRRNFKSGANDFSHSTNVLEWMIRRRNCWTASTGDYDSSSTVPGDHPLSSQMTNPLRPFPNRLTAPTFSPEAAITNYLGKR